MDYKYFREENKQWENVPVELWQWEARYADGRILRQYDDAGIFHQVKEIDRKQYLQFKIFSPDKKERVFIFLIKPFHKDIKFFHRLHAVGDTENVVGKICFFEYSVKVFEATVKTIVAITQNGEVILTDDPEDINF